MQININKLVPSQSGAADGGSDFFCRPIKSIGICYGNSIDAIVINGEHFGGDTESQTETLIFEHNEFISHMEIRSGNEIEHLLITTNLKRTIAAGKGDDGHTLTILDGTILTIGGNYGDRLNMLNIVGDMTIKH